jgi:hypothetical protein
MKFMAALTPYLRVAYNFCAGSRTGPVGVGRTP